MSSDLYVFDNSFFRQHSSPEMVSSDAADLNFSAVPFSPLCDSYLDFLQAISSSNSPTIINPNHPVDESSSIDQFAHTLLSCSPPSHLLENLSLCQSTHLQQPLANGYYDFSSLDALEVKSEESLVGFDSSYNHHHHQQQRQQQPFAPHSYSGVENVAKYMQRSYSSNSFDNKPGFLFQPRFDMLMESPNFHNQALSSPESNFFSGQMRRVCSTGDLQNIRTAHKTQRSPSSHLATESSFTEEANFKVGRYSAEERKERILKYRAKRNQRNFNKTIKYACRKTLADNRPRIRGRFARNDETGETPKAACAARDEDEDELWFDGLQEEDDHGAMRGAAFVSSYGQHQQLQYYGCF